MFVIQTHAAITLLVAIICCGCTDKDREMAQRHSDGTDTFHYVPTEQQPAPLKKTGQATTIESTSAITRASTSYSPRPNAVPQSVPTPSTTNVSGSPGFQYKPDPRLLKQLGKDRGH